MKEMESELQVFQIPECLLGVLEKVSSLKKQLKILQGRFSAKKLRKKPFFSEKLSRNMTAGLVVPPDLFGYTQ